MSRNPHIKAAQKADDINVCISWCTEGKENASFYGLIAKPDCVCINPLNWKTDDTYASADENLGCEMPDFSFSFKYTALSMKRYGCADVGYERPCF